MFNAPQRAKRLYFDVIPRAVDEYLANAARLPTQSPAEQKLNPAWHIHAGRLPNHGGSPVSFGMLLNLASVANADTPDILWGFIRRYMPGCHPETMPFLDQAGRPRHCLLPRLRPPGETLPPSRTLNAQRSPILPRH